MSEEDWLEYAERQLTIRQELTDANRQKRQPDPAIVPVVPTVPSRQGAKLCLLHDIQERFVLVSSAKYIEVI